MCIFCVVFIFIWCALQTKWILRKISQPDGNTPFEVTVFSHYNLWPIALSQSFTQLDGSNLTWTLATPKFRSLERHLNISVQMSTHLKLARRWYCVGWTNKAIRFHSNGEVLAILYCAEFWDQWICLFIYLTVRKLGWIDKTSTLT